ncbi:MAG: ComEC/Rec2 family competence protein [Lacisediminihabitans sp.]
MSVDLRLALPVSIAWVVLAVCLGFPGALSAGAAVAWAIAIAVTIGAFVLHKRAVVAMVIAVITAATALMLSSAAVQDVQRTPAVLTAAAASGRFVSAVAVTTETAMPHPSQSGAVTSTTVSSTAVRSSTASSGYMQPRSIRFSATLTSFTVGSSKTGGGWTHASVPVTVFGSLTPSAQMRIGTTIELSGTVATTEAGDDVSFLFFASGQPRIRAAPTGFPGWADGIREGFADAARALPGDGGALLPGLAIGDTSAVSPGLNTAMKTSALSHLTAVSGANCAVIIALIMAAGGALGIRRGWRITASVIVLVGFVVLVTPQPSVLRAAVMAVLVLAALGSGRPVRGVPVLALAVLILLTVDPWLARSYGFILSVLATGGLLVLSRPLTLHLARWLPLSLSAVIAIPLAAQLACQPVSILLNPSIPLYAVPANMLAEPAAPIATVLGLIACLTLPWCAPLGVFVARLAWLPASWIAGIARFFDSLPGKSVPWLPGALGVAVAAVTILLGLALALHRGRRVRRISAVVLVVIFVGYAGVVGGDYLRQAIARPQDWQIAACDIGQGDAVLVRSAGRVALVDTGPDPSLLRQCLDTLGVTRIDLLVLTHYDLDHVAGTPAVFGMVDCVMIGPSADEHDVRLAQQLRDGGARVNQVSRGESGELGELHFDVLWPPTRSGLVEPGNDSSVTVEFSGGGRCERGCLRSLFLGDLGNEPQARMLAANRGLGRVDVVKVAHHGSADQDPALYAKVAATIGIISVGAHNRYGHPTDHLLQILASVGTVAERTDRQGMVLVSPRPDGGMSVWSERPTSPADGGRE